MRRHAQRSSQVLRSDGPRQIKIPSSLQCFLTHTSKKKCFNHAVLTESSLYSLIEWVFEQLFQRKADLALLRAFTDYMKRARKFSDEGMNLYQMAEMHSQEVCFIVSSQPVIHLLTWCLKKKPLDLVLIWQRINTQADDKVPAGRNALMKLAICVLSVIANSAGCECSSSIFGNIHTKTRNKLVAETVHKTCVLKMDIRHRQIEEGRVSICKKQQFSTVDQPNCVTTPVSIDPGVSLIDFVQPLINKANDDDNTNLPTGKDGLDSAHPSVPLAVPFPTLPTNPPHQQGCRKIPLSDLFLYPSTAEGELDSGIVFYWKGGIKNLDAELASYDVEVEGQEVDGVVESEPVAE